MTKQERAYLLSLLPDLVDQNECWFDHRGGCQEHGYLSLAGAKCPQQELRDYIDRLDADA